MYKPDLIIFDLDGTLVDSAPDLATAVNTMLHNLGFAAASTDNICSWIGNGSAMLVKRALAAATEQKIDSLCPDLFEQAHELFFAAYRQCNGDETKVFEGVFDMLTTLQQQHIQLAIATNKPAEFTRQLLLKTCLNDFFSLTVSGDSLSRKKPDPEPLLHCLNHFNAKAQHTLMIGDSLTDLEAASRADITTIAYSGGYHRGANLADNQFGKFIVIDHYSQLMPLITKAA